MPKLWVSELWTTAEQLFDFRRRPLQFILSRRPDGRRGQYWLLLAGIGEAVSTGSWAVPSNGALRNGWSHTSTIHMTQLYLLCENWGFCLQPLRGAVEGTGLVWNFENWCRGKTLGGRVRLKCDGTRLEIRFRLSAKRTSPFKSAGWARGVRVSGSNAAYTMFRGSVKGTGYPLHSAVSPSLPLPCVTVCHHISTAV